MHKAPYIYGRSFTIECDQKPLVWLFSLKDPNSRLVKCRLRLEQFDFETKYKKGKENVVADALSRNEINTKETLTEQNNDDDDLDILSVFPNIDIDEEGDKYNIEYSRPFQKPHYVVSLRRGQKCENIAQMLKEITNPNILYGIFLAIKLSKHIFVNFL